MDEQTFQAKFAELLSKIQERPDEQRHRLEKLAEQSKERRTRIQSSLSELQESLDYLRLTVKYLVFDLEATRRENAYLRRLIEQSSRDQSPRPEGPGDNFLEEDGDDPDE